MRITFDNPRGALGKQSVKAGPSESKGEQTKIDTGMWAGPSTDPVLNSRLKEPHDNRALPWKLLCALLVVALLYTVWAGKTTNRQQASVNQQKAQSVSIGLKLAPTNLDIRRQSGSALDQVLIGNVYEGLVSRDENNKVQPALAKSWDISADAKTYTFHLNTGIRFSNGNGLDANDVVWSINELISHKYHSAEQLRNVESIRALNPHTVELKLSAPYSDVLWVLSGRAGLVFDKNAQYDPKTQAVGSGPYVITRFVANDSITLEANPRYWGNHPALTPTILLRYFTDDNAAVNAMLSNDVQVLAPVSANLRAPFERDKQRYSLHVGKGTDKYVLALNCKDGKTTDLKVRQAIRHAINHKELIASRGGADIAMGGPIPFLDPGYEDLNNLYPYNPAEARELMLQAGYSQDKPLTLRLMYANTYGSEIGEQLRSQLKQIGIDLQVQMVEFSTWMQTVYINHDYDLSLVDHSESHDFVQWTNPNYYYGYDSAEVQELYKEAAAARTNEESAKLLAKAARKVSQDAPADWLFNYQITTVIVSGIQGFPFSLNQTLMPLWNVSYQPNHTNVAQAKDSLSNDFQQELPTLIGSKTLSALALVRARAESI